MASPATSPDVVREAGYADPGYITTSYLSGHERLNGLVPMASRTSFAVGSAKLSNGTDTSHTLRTAHTALLTAAHPRLVYVNGFNNNGTETIGRNDIAIQAALETPLNTLFPVTFQGQHTVIVKPGAMVISDPVGLVFAKGSSFWTRTYMTGSGVSFTDGVANSTTTYTSAIANFTQADVGRSIVGSNIPAGTTVAAVASATSITLSAAATATASALTFILGRASVPVAEGPATLVWPLNQQQSFSTISEGKNINTNLAQAGTITNTASIDISGPLTILGVPKTRPAAVIGLIGDSIMGGVGDITPSTPQPLPGYFIRALNNNYCFMHLAMASDSALLWNTASNRKLRLPFLDYCTHLVVALGTNSQGSAQADLTTLYSTLSNFGLPMWAMTIPPRTTSSDSWATTANQTVTANETARVNTNAFIRALPTGISGFFEVADQLETARDSGLWQSVGSGLAATITGDGIHPNSAGCAQIAAASAFNATALAKAFGSVTV